MPAIDVQSLLTLYLEGPPRMMSTSITLPGWRINAPPIDACLVYNQQHSWTQRKPLTPKHTHTRPCYAKKVCSNKRSLLIVQQQSLHDLSSPNRAAHNTVFLYLRTTCPPARTLQPIIYFLIKTPLWASSSRPVGDISQASSAFSLHWSPPFYPSRWKEGSLTLRLSITCSVSAPSPKPENLPTSLPLWILKILSWEGAKNCQDGRLQYMFSPALSYPTMPLCLEWLSG